MLHKVAGMEIVETPGFLFLSSSSLFIAGPSGSGKTQLLTHILKQRNEFYSEKSECVVVCYREWQKLYDGLKEDPEIDFFYGLPSEDDINKFIQRCGENEYLTLVLDDLMSEVSNSDIVEKLTVHIVHHRKVNLIYLAQNLFYKGKHSRSQSLNFHYFILLNSRRDVRQVVNLGSQMFPGRAKQFREIYEDCMNNPLSTYAPPHLFVNVHPRGLREFQLQSNLFPLNDDTPRVVYRL